MGKSLLVPAWSEQGSLIHPPAVENCRLYVQSFKTLEVLSNKLDKLCSRTLTRSL